MFTCSVNIRPKSKGDPQSLMKPTSFMSWFPSLFKRRGSKQDIKKTAPSKKSITLSVSNRVIPDCCRQNAKVAMASSRNSSLPSIHFHRFRYRLVDEIKLQHIGMIVGGHRVPYFPSQVHQIRQQRPYGTTLFPIQERTSQCESCHSFKFSSQPSSSTITLTRVSRPSGKYTDKLFKAPLEALP